MAPADLATEFDNTVHSKSAEFICVAAPTGNFLLASDRIQTAHAATLWDPITAGIKKMCLDKKAPLLTSHPDFSTLIQALLEHNDIYE